MISHDQQISRLCRVLRSLLHDGKWANVSISINAGNIVNVKVENSFKLDSEDLSIPFEGEKDEEVRPRGH